MIAYLIDVYLNIYAYGKYLFMLLAAASIVGGLILGFVMADNSEKGTLDFSLEYMRERAKAYSSVILWWRRALILFIMVASVAIFAPSPQIVKGWQAGSLVCAPA